MNCLECGQLLTQVGNFWVCPSHGLQPHEPPSHGLPLSEIENHHLTVLARDLPFPIATVVQEYVAETNPFIKLHRLKDAAETLTSFAAGLVLSDLQRQLGQFPVPLRRLLVDKIMRPTFGAWKELLERACDALPQRAGRKECFVAELPAYVRQTLLPALGDGGGDVTRHIIVLRNLLAHPGRIFDTQAQELLAYHQPTFESLLAQLAFLTRYDLVAFAGNGRALLMRGFARQNGSFPVYELPASLQPLPDERVALIHGEELLDVFPLQVFGEVLQWREEGRTRVDGAVPQLYRAGHEKYLEFTPLDGIATYSQRRGAALERFHELFRLEDWQHLSEAERRRKELMFDDLVEELCAGFVGREPHVRRVKEWIRGHESGVLWISGSPGVGKSALMAELVRRYRDAPDHYVIIPYFFHVGHSGCSIDHFLKAVLLHLHTALAERTELAPTISKRRRQFVDVVWRAGERLSKRILFLIDGLDEIHRLEPNFVSLLFEANAPHVVWVCAGRDEQPGVGTALRAGGAEWAFPDGLPPLDEPAIRAMLIKHLGKDDKYPLLYRDELKKGSYHNRFIEVITRKSEGLPLYLRMFIEDYRLRKWTFTDEDKLPEGLDAYYERVLERLRVSDVGTVLTSLFCLLAWAQEPVTESTLGLLLSTHSFSQEPDWQELFCETLEYGHLMLRRTATPDGVAGLMFNYETFRRHLRESNIVRRARNVAQRIWLEHCAQWRTLGEESLRRYALRNFAIHLSEAEEYLALQELIDRDFLLAKRDEFGSYYFATDDVLCAKNAARERRDAPGLIKCCLLQAMLGSLSAEEHSAVGLILSAADNYDEALKRTQALSDQQSKFENLLLITEVCLLAGQIKKGLNSLDIALSLELNIQARVPLISKIVSLIAKVDTQRAVGLAEKGAGGAEIVLLVQAAENLLQEDAATAKRLLEHALGLVETIQGTAIAPKEVTQNYFLNYIAIRLAKVDLGAVQKIKKVLADNDWAFLYEKEGGLEAELVGMCQADADAAIECADRYAEPLRTQLLCSIAGELTADDLVKAQTLLLRLQKTASDKTLEALSKAVAKVSSAIGRSNIKLGLLVTTSIPDERIRRQAMARLVARHYAADKELVTPYLEDMLNPIDPQVLVTLAGAVPDVSIEIMNQCLSPDRPDEAAKKIFSDGYVYPDLLLAYPIRPHVGYWATEVVDAAISGACQSAPNPRLLNKLFAHVDDVFTTLHLTANLACAFGVDYARGLKPSASPSQYQRAMSLQYLDTLFRCVGIEKQLAPLTSARELAIACEGLSSTLYDTKVTEALASAFVNSNKDVAVRLCRALLEMIPGINNQAKRIRATLNVSELLRSLDVKKAWVVLGRAAHIYKTEVRGDAEYISDFLATPPLRGIVRQLTRIEEIRPRRHEPLWGYLLSCDAGAETFASIGNELLDSQPEQARRFLERAAQIAAEKKRPGGEESDESSALHADVEARVANAIIENSAPSLRCALDSILKQDEPYQTRYLCKTAGWMAGLDIEEGLKLASQVKQTGYRALALSEVVKATALSDPDRAIQLASDIPSLYVNANWHDLSMRSGSGYYPLNPRHEALVAVAEVVRVRGDLEGGLKILAAAASEIDTLEEVLGILLRQYADTPRALLRAYDKVKSFVECAADGSATVQPCSGAFVQKVSEALNEQPADSAEVKWWAAYEASTLGTLFPPS